MITRALSIVGSADPGAPLAADPVLDLNAFAVADDVDLTIVLARAGVELAVADARVHATTVAGVDVPAATAGTDVSALLASGVRVLALAADLADRGIAPDELVPGVATIDDAGLAALVLASDVTLGWST